MRPDCVVSLRDNIWTSGVAKFSRQLADRLGIPHVVAAQAYKFRHPLWSIKISELPAGQLLGARPPYSLFLHDADDTCGALVRDAVTVYAGNRVIAARCRAWRPDVVSAWCPSLMTGRADRGAYRVLCYGMAGKIDLAAYADLKADLDELGIEYTVSVSTAIHEGMSWAEMDQLALALRGIFGDRLRLLGYLADDALAREMAESHLIALSFSPALRENNTTYWAALASGTPVVVNRDAESPSDDTPHSWEALMTLFRASASLVAVLLLVGCGDLASPASPSSASVRAPVEVVMPADDWRCRAQFVRRPDPALDAWRQEHCR